jgi:hypothetical protein
MVSMACWTFQRLCGEGGVSCDVLILWRFVKGGIVGLDLLVDGCVFSETAEFALDGDAAWVMRSGLDGVEGRSALGVSVVVVVVEIAGAVVEPAACGVHEPCWVQGVYEVGESEFGVFAVGDLAPAFVIDDPGDDAGVAAVLANEKF